MEAETPPAPPAQGEPVPAEPDFPKPELPDIPAAAREEMELTDFLALHPGLEYLPAEDTLTGQVLQADLDGDGTEETLSVTQTPLDVSDDMANLPVRVTLRADNAETQVDSAWNDGVEVSLQDLDASDGKMEILVLSHNTDVSFWAKLYQYDGTTVTEIVDFNGGYDCMFTNRRGELWYNSAQGRESITGLPWLCLNLGGLSPADGA